MVSRDLPDKMRRQQPLRRCGEGGLGAFLFSSAVSVFMELVIFSEHPGAHQRVWDCVWETGW